MRGFWQCKGVPGPTHVRIQKLIAWEAPHVDSVKINVDGAATANPRMLTARGLCRDNQGQWIIGFMLKLGQWCILQAKDSCYSYWTQTCLAKRILKSAA